MVRRIPFIYLSIYIQFRNYIMIVYTSESIVGDVDVLLGRF